MYEYRFRSRMEHYNSSKSIIRYRTTDNTIRYNYPNYYNVTISEDENNNNKILFSKLFTSAGQSLPRELISAEGNETISYEPDSNSTGACHVQSDFKKGSTYPISVEIISINSKPVESIIKVLFDFRTA